MEHFFLNFRKGIIGINEEVQTPYHQAIPLIYADWTASGRMYHPIEERILKELSPFVANTHTDTNYTSSTMTFAYQKARNIIKQHVAANDSDILISSNAGMTGVINKFQRILGLKIHESFKNNVNIPEEERPLVLITHMEHHSNQTSWSETIADVIIVPPDGRGLVSVKNFENILKKYPHRTRKIAAITACSNVTGIITPYMEIAELMHFYKGLCFVDFACSAPYVTIDMHEDDHSGRYLDAITFSPHKFLGGPGTTGILVFNKKLYKNTIPDNVGGGTVTWTNPWGEHQYFEPIEIREDGGTPPFLQTIKVAMCLQLKEEMGVVNMKLREDEILKYIWKELSPLPNLHILDCEHRNRLGIISFYIDQLHHNLGVKMLNDRFGIQTRGGCSCAGTYGHYLLNVSREDSRKITDLIDSEDHSQKPGWIRLSIHPTHTDDEIRFMMMAVKELASKHQDWAKDYHIEYTTGTVKHHSSTSEKALHQKVEDCFTKTFAVKNELAIGNK
ncbi:aminotransferase class V-fold PLP-dependent enzyme [Flammeovirga pacifica]|uniref:Selenocysteine lyase n=1 Tax=Flammeovirga pacifica TaxID=915059 RepID=A0A1S1YRY7_FLAPC|nr:aminotransferase class V-fold PLP-dependent enzyme [Flammeovirga pacifica]OHX63797.1 selenocysteine lyase [Flammeovirga pacifica]